ncbi:MAG: tetratricopeptide repeat protein [Candidatus Eremiobacterota bacterium]
MKHLVFLTILCLFTVFIITYASAQENTAEDWNRHGVKLFNEGKYEEAIYCYDRALVRDPDSYQIWINKGNAYFKPGNYEKACGCYNEVLKHKPEYVTVLTFK